MSATKLLTLINAEIATLQRARSLLAATGKKRSGRPAKAPAAPAVTQKKKRKLSPEGRARLVAAVKARWAKQRKAGK
jgi:hypothetical protein